MVPPIYLFAEAVVFFFGIWIGWRLTRPAPGEVPVSRRELWRHGPDPTRYRQNPKALRVKVSAFGVALASGGLVALADYIDSFPLRIVAFGLGVVSIGTGFGAALFNRLLRK